MSEAQQVYDRLWSQAVPALETGRPGIDPHLPDKANDPRRGISLLLRLQPAVRDVLEAFVGRLKTAAPGQYFYQPEEFHITVLAIIPGSEFWRDRLPHLPASQALIRQVLKAHREFSIVLRGVTASPGAVMIQGFPGDDTLEQIRARLREAFRSRQLGEALDRRYKINTAHVTVMRFCRPDDDWKRLKAVLEASRATPFGESRVQTLQLVQGDWYASADQIRVLEEYRLGNQSGVIEIT